MIKHRIQIESFKIYPDLCVKPVSLASPALAGGFFTTGPPGKPPQGAYGGTQKTHSGLSLDFL